MILVFVILQQVSKQSDARRFAAAQKTKDAVVAELVDYLGDNVVSTRKQNECFNTEQGPYDNGYLWCQTASIVLLRSNVDFMDLSTKFIAVARADGFTAENSDSDSPIARSWFEFDEGLSCNLSSKDVSGDEHGGATSDPLYQIAPPAFAVSCADRAKAKHYPHVED